MVESNKITECFFRLSREDGTYASEPIRLNCDGTIYGYSHPNESSWTFINGHVAFLNSDGVASTIFDECKIIGNKIIMKGDFCLIPNTKIRHKLEQIDFNWSERPRFGLLTKKHLAIPIQQFEWEIGDHTYGVPLVLEPGGAKLKIGKFCSIAGGVTIILGNHNTHTATTYPFVSLQEFWPGARGLNIADHYSNGDVVIKNDVWIGHGATIMSGVTIGNGAVIAAHSVVSKDVPPYAIVGGVPAKVLRFRHSQDQIESLLNMEWWDWADEIIDERISILMGDLNVFLAAFADPISGDIERS